jgi:hypothetical protein
VHAPLAVQDVSRPRRLVLARHAIVQRLSRR